MDNIFNFGDYVLLNMTHFSFKITNRLSSEITAISSFSLGKSVKILFNQLTELMLAYHKICQQQLFLIVSNISKGFVFFGSCKSPLIILIYYKRFEDAKLDRCSKSGYWWLLHSFAFNALWFSPEYMSNKIWTYNELYNVETLNSWYPWV